MGVAGDWLRSFVCSRLWVSGVVHGLCEAPGICAIRGVSNYRRNSGFVLGVEAWAVRIEIGQTFGELCAAPAGLCSPRANGPTALAFTLFRASAVGYVLSSLTGLAAGSMFLFRGFSEACNDRR